MTARNRLIQYTADNIIDALRMGAIAHNNTANVVVVDYIEMAAEDDATFADLWNKYDANKRYRVMNAVRRYVELNKNK
jgi:hypothetical protein